ncbi:MAG: VWA domain-containing protein [Nitrospinota bacterium]|nr:VWA domain-containing protein [Nitrospinota bacterium]
MRFADPSYFYLLWTLVPLIFFLIWSNLKKYDLIVRFCGANLFSKLVTLNFKELQKSKAIFVILTFLFLFIALTRPQWGYQWEDYKQEGVDIIIALDVSRSMLAKDIKPNRLERAKRKISDLLNMLKGDRIGLVAFAGTSFVQCPLTLDYAAARIFLNAIDTDLIPVQGTAIGDALRKSTNAFRTQENKSRAIILITDGEDQTGQAMEAAEEAKKAGVKVFTIGIGKEIGAPLPDPNKASGFLKNENGDVILTKLDEAILQQISLKTGGSYVRSVTGDIDLKTIYLDQINQKLDKNKFKSERRKIWQERFQWFIFLAFLFMVYESSLSTRKIELNS